MFVCFVINLLLYKVSGVPTEFVDRSGLVTEEVPFGETVLLTCKSNGPDYNFDFWLFDKGKIVIGPSNDAQYDRLKYRYEILSGNLTIRAVTKHDEGRYTCVSKQVHGNKINVDDVSVIVIPGWEQEYEHNSKINAIRILIVLIVLVILGAGGYFLYTIWRDRYRYPRYLEQSEDEDEDSAEEIFTAPSTSGTSKFDKKKEQDNQSFDNISTDFKSILDAANEK